MVLEQAISEINNTLDAEQTLTKFEFFIDGSTSKALESLEKLKSRFYNKTAVTIPRINEIMGELSPEILSVQNFLESTISTKGKDLESIYRLTIETIHDYEYVLIAKLMELLNISSRNLLTRISQLQSSGINIQSLVGEQIEVFSQLLQADTSDMMSIEMITQSFVELDKIYGNEELQKALFKIIDEKSTNAGRILDFIQALGWKNTQTTILPHVVAIRQSRSSIQFWSFDLISKAAIDVNTAAKELSKAICALENKIYEEYQIELANDSTLPYYPSIIKIFEFKFEDCSRNIFPLQELYEARKKLQESENLEEIYKLLAIIAKLTTQWKNECLPKLSRWHRVLFLFISDYQPTSIRDDKISFIANARREIEDTYNNQELIQYLNSAVEYYVSAR
jgi:biotin operon repressor